ncbi:ornithine cyclodeaminase family protein [Corynebacterium bovis]|uniref:ornithine cyclodeaminase family protein n=1 Tax=Corynebacterium bovis TaxID=36808 RepID=UPI00313A1273
MSEADRATEVTPEFTWTDGEELRRRLSMRTLVDVTRAAFIDHQHGRFEIPVRETLDDGALLVMPIRHRNIPGLAVKTMSLNSDRNPTIAGTVLWEDPERVRHVLVDGATATTMRTGAVSGVATDLLAREGARHLVVVGAGGQAPDQVRAVAAVRDLTTVTIVSRRLESARRCVERLADDPALEGVEITAAEDVRAAVGRADIVCCVTPAEEPLFRLDDLAPGTHVNLIGSFRPSMREMSGHDVASVDRLVVDDIEAVTTESGEIIDALEAGELTVDGLETLGAALIAEDEAKAREGEPPVVGGRYGAEEPVDGIPDGLTVFKSVGVAIQDWALMRAVSGE